jgi:hypothetical protein
MLSLILYSVEHEISNFQFQFWFYTEPLTDIKLFINSRYFTKIRVFCIRHWRIIVNYAHEWFIPRLMKVTNIYHSLTISFTYISSSISSIFISVASWMLSSLTSRCHSSSFSSSSTLCTGTRDWWLLPSSGVDYFLNKDWITTSKNTSRTRIIVIRTWYWFRFNY